MGRRRRRKRRKRKKRKKRKRKRRWRKKREERNGRKGRERRKGKGREGNELFGVRQLLRPGKSFCLLAMVQVGFRENEYFKGKSAFEIFVREMTGY
jgi:hypothetical protein